MIYLVQSYYNDKQNHPRKCLKIGYAKNIEDRMKAYKTYNPSIQLLKTREGEYDLESFLHRYFDKYKLPDFNEWFIYKREIIDKFDILDPLDETITREEYLEYIRKEIVTNIIPEIYKDLRSHIPDLLDELKQEFDNNYSMYSFLYTNFPENECKEIIIRSFKFLRETENNYFSNCDFSTDILDKFPEEVPRQRLKENVFRNECIFIFSLSDKNITMDQFEELKNKKLQFTQNDIKNFDLLVSNSGSLENILFDLRTRIKNYKYQNDYTGISEKEGRIVINKLVMLAERRAFELRSNVYKTTFSVYDELSNISSEDISLETTRYIQYSINLAKERFVEETFFTEKMKIVCELLLDTFLRGRMSISDLYWLPREFKNYINYLGPEKIRALSYIEKDIKREMINLQAGSDIRKEFISIFKIGSRYSLLEIKENVSIAYQKLNLSKTPKAVDIEEFFNIKKCTISKDGKRVNGYEILSLK